jgi:hypothetical protein
MAHIVADRVKDTTTTTGTGSLTLANSAPSSFQTFGAVCANNDTCFYCIAHQAANEWEVGFGTYATTGPALARTTVIASSNAGAAVNFSAGTKDVFITSPAQTQTWGELSPAQITANQNNYNPTGLATANMLRLTSDQTRKITGLAGGVHGRKVEILNVNTAQDGDLVLTFEDPASTAANRFAFENDVVLEPTEGAVLTYDGLSARWRCSAIRRRYTGTTFRHTPFYVTDFLGAGSADTGEASYAIWDTSLIGTGPTQSKIASEANHPGILQLTSGTTANSGWFIRTDTLAALLAGGEIAEFVFKAPAVFTNTTGRFGFIDSATSADCVDGAYFEFSGSGVLVGKTSNNSTRTTSATIATMTASTWYRLRVVVNRAATAVDFSVFDDAGNQLGTVQNTANIPTATGRETGHGMILTNSGTAATAMGQIDYMSIEWTRALI